MSTLTMKIMRHGEIETLACDLSQPVEWTASEWSDVAEDLNADYFGFVLDINVGDGDEPDDIQWSVKASALVSEYPELWNCGFVPIVRGDLFKAIEVCKFKAQAAARKAVRSTVAAQAAR